MAAGRTNLNIEQGATWRRTLSLTDDIGSGIDLTEFTAKMQIRDDFQGTLYICLSTYNGSITIPNPESGSIYIYLADDDTKNVNIEQGKWDLELYKDLGSSTETLRLLQGNVRISPEVTLDEC